MAASSTVTTGDIATAAQYNNLRTDVLDSSSSHTHAGTSNTGVKVNSNNLQGTVLASTVVTSSLTTVGTIATGVWQGTDVGVAYGGTGVSTLTDGGVLLGSGASAITAMAVLTDGQMIVGNGSTDPVAESGATLRTSIGVGTGDSPQFTGLTLTGDLAVNGDDITSDGGLTITPTTDTFFADGTGVVIGHTAQIATEATPETQILGTGSADSSLLIAGFGSNIPPRIHFVSSDAAIGSHDILEDNDLIGELRYYPDDGVDYATRAASFYVEVDDASPEAGGVGTAFVWKQMPGGGTTAAQETMRIGANGMMTLGGAIERDSGIILDGHAQDFHIGLDDTADDLVIGLGSALGTTTAMSIDSDLHFAIGAATSTGNVFNIQKTDTAAARSLVVQGALTLPSGGGNGEQIRASGTIATPAESTVYTTISTVRIHEPTITLGSGSSLTNSASLYVTGAATEATNDYALWVDAGTSRFDGNVGIQTSTSTLYTPLTVLKDATLGFTIVSDTSHTEYAGMGATADYAHFYGGSGQSATVGMKFYTAISGDEQNSMILSGGISPTLQLGVASTADSKILFDGNAVDYHIGLDDSADALVIGTGSTLGSGTSMVFGSTEGRVAIGNNSDAGGQIGVAANTGIHSDWNFGDIGNSTHQGLNMTTRASQTGASGSGAVRHLFQSGVRTGSDQNWTGTPGVAGVATYLFTESSSSGVVTDMRDIWVMTGAAGGATVTNKYGIYIEDQTIATNDYGLYIAGADTYAIWVDADPCRFDDDILVENGGHIGIQDNTPTEAELVITNSDNAATTLMKTTDAGGTGAHTHWDINNTNGQVGTVNTSGSTTSFNTSSDYRLKENIVDLTGAINRVKELKPKRFNFKADATETFDGFLAHEAAEVVPISVTGTKDEMDGSDPVYQGMDSSKLVPLLTAAIKELEARVTALE